MKSPKARTLRRPVVPLPCACANLRRAERVVTHLYDATLRPSGVRTTQFTLLQALHYAPAIPQRQLAGLLEIDSTTLTRTLAPHIRRGWVRSEAGADRRELRLSLTPAGQQKYKRVLPYWQKAQKMLRQALGEETWTRLVDASVRTAAAVLDSG